MSRTPYALLILLLVLGLASLADSTPQADPTIPNTTVTVTSASSDPNAQCGFRGDDNTYGLGIRVGVYLQWITSAIAYAFLPDEGATMRGVNLCFVLSNFAGLLYITFSRGNGQPSNQLFAVEVWIVLSFCLGGVCSGAETTYAGYKASTIGWMVQLALLGAMLYYTIWYLYIGMDTMMAPPCSRFAFFFTKVDLFHWFRTLNKVLFTMAIPIYSIAFISTVFYFITSWERFIVLLTSANPEDPRRYPYNLTLSFAMVFFIISTELIIKWNHITGVNSIKGTGQILPAVVAGASLLRVIWKLLFIKSEHNDDAIALNPIV